MTECGGNLIYQQNLRCDCATESLEALVMTLWNENDFSFAPWRQYLERSGSLGCSGNAWSLPMALERSRHSDLFTDCQPVDLQLICSEKFSSQKQQWILFFFHFLWDFFRHLLMLLRMSLCLCQQTPRQLHLPFARTAPTGGECILPWGLLLFGPVSQTGSATLPYLIGESVCLGSVHMIQDQQPKPVT